MDLDLNQYINLFVEEAKEHLQNMNEALLELEKDKDNVSLINELFRVAHTLKGMSGTMGFVNMANLTHEMENVLEGIRSHEIELSETVIDIIFECFDVLDDSVNQIAENGKESSEEHDALIEKLRTVLRGNNATEVKENNNRVNDIFLNEYVLNIAKEAKIKGLNIFNIKIELSPKCMLKSARAFIIFNTLESIGDIIYSNPSVEDIEDEKFDFNFSLVFISEIHEEKLRDELNSISEIDKIHISVLEDIETAKVGQDLVKEAENLKKDIEELAVSRSKNSTSTRDSRIGKTVRVDIDRLDNLMNLVSELIIIKTRMDDLSDISNKENMIEAIEYLERITTSLHDAVMKVRMVPIERVFNRFPRMVRDLSKELNKEIDLQMYGEDTEVDRTVIDEIGDPLIHIVRNSIDHGIETPENRINQGKPKEGTVILKAYPDGNNVVIEVVDDGKGIDIEGVKRKAIEKEIITDQEAEILSEEEIKTLLFQPGFSTSEEISDVSGRGVGLDVVKSKIESINGSIEIDSETDIGTKFIIRIPLTLAIIQALLVKLKDEIYAIPLSSITEITSVTKDSIRNIQGQDIMLYRGKTIPMVRLHRLMGLEFSNTDDEYLVVVVRKGEKQAALLVDSLIGQQEIVIKPLGKYLSNIKYLSGATILGNGNVSLILDVNSII
ncbi:Chemotaxis protein CheA [[Clostridium] ultunense Esp]|uniref:Chemotaxis protein CheA n=1 Tax=[Clostridium] ultunense Esp TaxID=1288971 RepID=M1Z5J8_9FIRM|nr:chemotaxis protein CheA [Schnuerera ultunensis]CCQ93034.1 Chemotaxis protein CheA [[Clostridium] ultunense Esp]SHD77037.1 chemotactic two-component sensor histidine kinase [[Clostridium] ultunense Esp]